MKRSFLTFLAVLLVCGATFGAMAVEAQQIFQPIVLDTIQPELTTQASTDLSPTRITTDHLFLFGVTVGVMASICTLSIVLMVSGRTVVDLESKRKPAGHKRK